MSTKLAQILKELLLPTLLIVAARLASYYLVAFLSKQTLVWQQVQGFIYRPEVNTANLVDFATYSDLIFFVVVLLGLSVNIISAFYFHDSHVENTLLIKLAKFNLLNLIKASAQLYQKAFIWLVYSWISLTLIIVNVAQQQTAPWLGITCFLATLLLTTFIIYDAYRELEIAHER